MSFDGRSGGFLTTERLVAIGAGIAGYDVFFGYDTPSRDEIEAYQYPITVVRDLGSFRPRTSGRGMDYHFPVVEVSVVAIQGDLFSGFNLASFNANGLHGKAWNIDATTQMVYMLQMDGPEDLGLDSTKRGTLRMIFRGMLTYTYTT